jgi:hypothetical protein
MLLPSFLGVMVVMLMFVVITVPVEQPNRQNDTTNDQHPSEKIALPLGLLFLAQSVITIHDQNDDDRDNYDHNDQPKQILRTLMRHVSTLLLVHFFHSFLKVKS